MNHRNTNTRSTARFSWIAGGVVGASITALTLTAGVAAAEGDTELEMIPLPQPTLDAPDLTMDGPILFPSDDPVLIADAGDVIDEDADADAPHTRGKRKGKRDLPPGLQVCKEQLDAVCGEVEPGDGRIKTCVAENRARFDPQCQEAFDRIAERKKGKKAKKGERNKKKRGVKKQVRAACEADVRAVCGTPESREELRACVAENRASFSDTCQDALEKAKKAKKAGKNKKNAKNGKKNRKNEGKRKNRSMARR